MEAVQEIDLCRAYPSLDYAIKAAKHVRAVLDTDLPAGEIQWIPVGEFGADAVKLILGLILDKAWGHDAYTIAASGRDLFLMRITA